MIAAFLNHYDIVVHLVTMIVSLIVDTIKYPEVISLRFRRSTVTYIFLIVFGNAWLNSI